MQLPPLPKHKPTITSLLFPASGAEPLTRTVRTWNPSLHSGSSTCPHSPDCSPDTGFRPDPVARQLPSQRPQRGGGAVADDEQRQPQHEQQHPVGVGAGVGAGVDGHHCPDSVAVAAVGKRRELRPHSLGLDTANICGGDNQIN